MQTIADCNVHMTGPYGGWDFIRKWMNAGAAFVQQLDRDGWTREPCRLPRLGGCVPDKLKRVGFTCKMHRPTHRDPDDLFAACNYTHSPVAMPWEIQVGRTNQPWRTIASGLTVATEASADRSPGGSFVAEGASTAVTVNYPLRDLVFSGHGKALVIEDTTSDSPGACQKVSDYRIFGETVTRRREVPVAWSLQECQIAEFVKTVKPAPG